ncbi:MAG TPA: nuclear transport factor 2 family protein [Vicinamibacterales bacterium]|nr:nuclear transport factor 2 family protein [Vicinamibacterales bacterium]
MTRHLIAVVVVAAGLWFGWQWLFPSDEAQIVGVLERIADGVSSSAEDGELGRLARAASLRNQFAPDVTVDAGPPFQRLRGREAMIGAAARTSGSVRNLEITFPDVAIAIASDRQSATAVVTAEARFDEGGGRGIDARELELGFTRHEGNWVISAVTIVQPLQRLP